jgi:hypothetical protein
MHNTVVLLALALAFAAQTVPTTPPDVAPPASLTADNVAPPAPLTADSDVTPPQAPDVEPAPPATPSTPGTTGASDAAYARCLASARTDEARLVERCFLDVAAAHPDSLAAVRATANATLLQVEHDVANSAAQNGWLPPGRLELVGVGGLFGVWNAIAGGIVVGANVQGSNPGVLLLGTAGASLALGVGLGIGGARLGEALHLDEGASRLVASGLVWGSNAGIGLLPVVFAADRNGNGTSAVLTVLGAGWVGGLSALALTNVLDVDAPSMSMINSGGIWGSVVGGMVMLNLTNNQVSQSGAYSAAYIGSSVVGLVGGGLLSTTMKPTYAETLIFDLGAVVGGSVLGLGTVGTLALVSTNSTSLFMPIVTSAVSVGVLGGYAAGIATVSLLRTVDAPLFVPKLATPLPTNVVDSAGQPVPIVNVLALAL